MGIAEQAVAEQERKEPDRQRQEDRQRLVPDVADEAEPQQAEGAGLAVGQRRLAADLGLGDALDMAIEKIAGAGGRALRSGVEQGRARVMVDVDPWHRSGEAVPLLPALHDAVIQGRRVDLDYRDSEFRARRVTADPLGLVAKAGVWYLVTTDPALFRVSRIGNLTVRPEPAIRPDGLDLATTWAELRDRVEVRPRDLAVTISVRPEALGRVQRVLGITGIGPVLHVRFNGVAHAVGSLLGLGTQVEVLAPPEVRAGLVAAARSVIDLYQPGAATPPDVA